MGEHQNPATNVTPDLVFRGSVKTIAEFFYFSLNAVLYQRGIYPQTEFDKVHKWGLPLVVAVNPDVNRYLKTVVRQLQEWLKQRSLMEFLLSILDERETTVEQWHFHIMQPSAAVAGAAGAERGGPQVTEATTREDLQRVMRQVGMSVSFLPLLQGRHTFRVSVVDDATQEIPLTWAEAPGRKVEGAHSVQLHPVKTSSFTVGAQVFYQTHTATDPHPC